MSKGLSYIGLALAVLLWGVSFVSIAVVVAHLSVSELNIIRFVLSNVILWMIQLLRPKPMSFERRDLPIIAFAGVLGTGAYYYFENLGLLFVNPGVVSVVTGAIPVLTLVVAMLFFGKKTRFKNIFLVFLSFGGIIILMNPWSEGSAISVTGIGVVMIANVFWALYTLFNEGLNRKYDKLQLLTLQYTAGMVAFAGFYLYELSRNPSMKVLSISGILANTEILGHLIFIGVFVSIGAYFLYNHALSHLGVMISALFINVVPVVTLIVSVSMGFEALTFSKVAGCLLVVIAIFFIDDI